MHIKSVYNVNLIGYGQRLKSNEYKFYQVVIQCDEIIIMFYVSKVIYTTKNGFM